MCALWVLPSSSESARLWWELVALATRKTVTAPFNFPMSVANDAAFLSPTGEVANRQADKELSLSILPEATFRDGSLDRLTQMYDMHCRACITIVTWRGIIKEVATYRIFLPYLFLSCLVLYVMYYPNQEHYLAKDRNLVQIQNASYFLSGVAFLVTVTMPRLVRPTASSV